MKEGLQTGETTTGTRLAASDPLWDRGSVERWLQGGELSAIDRHFARLMERLCGGPNSEVTIAAALVSQIHGQGSVCLELRKVAGTILPNAGATAGADLPLPSLEAWMTALRKATVVGRPAEFKPLILDDSGRLYLHRYWQYESDLAKRILDCAQRDTEGVDASLLEEGLARLFSAGASSNETDWQRVAAATAVRKRFCVISGGPGTGKTRTVIALLALLLEQARENPLRIALAAPTGKAAARLQESLQKWKAALPCDAALQAGLPKDSFTLHRLLGGLPDSAQFRHGAENPLPFDVVVVDEASMVDLALMAKLFAATAPSARLILVGDKDQLSSVEAGAVLGDICAGATRTSGPSALSACIVHLEKNYRFGADNGILALSRAINDGDAAEVLRLLNLRAAGASPERSEDALPGESGGNRPADPGIAGLALPPPAQLKGRMRAKVLEGFGAVMRARDPLSALQALGRFRVLCAVRKGPMGVEALNRTIEEILSEAGFIAPRERWYRGRPVLVTSNDYTLKLFNGDVGIILPDAASGELRAWFLDAGSSLRSVPPVRLPEHETVFAMTVHKSQGSEFEEVLLMLPGRESPVLSRELLYTGVTRASRRVELWGDEAVLRTAIATRVTRASGLREALWGTATAE